MSELIDLTGKRFGKLVVLKRVENNMHRQPQWECLCDCGNKTIVVGQKLRKGITKSCGCLVYEQKARMTHGMTGTVLHNRWLNMKSRCFNPKNKRYARYGGRGITVCPEWMDFSNFYEWSMANGFSENLSLDRIDNDKGYSPENCRWANPKQQSNNTSRNVKICYNGEEKTLSEWCELLNLDYKLIHGRIHQSGMTFEEAITNPLVEYRSHPRK